MAWGVATLVVAALFMTGLARFSGEERTERATLTDERRALTKPSLLAHGGGRENTEITIPQTGQQRPVPRSQTAIPAETAAEPPADGSRSDGSRKTAVVEAATPAPAPEIRPIAASPAAYLPPVEAVTPPEQVSDTAHEGSEINGPAVGQEDVAMAAPDRVLPDFESMDAPAAGDGEEKRVAADDQPVAPPVSREEKIATLLAQGQQSLRQFRLLTPAGDNANQYFKEVLALDPGNADARDGFNLIAERYVVLVRRANERHDSKLARLYISRGLQVRPGNRALLAALQDSMRKPPVTARETVAEVSPAVEPEPPPEQTGFFSRLKALITGKREEPAEVVERSIMSENR